MTQGSELCLINITGEDTVGLIAEVTAYLFDTGADLRDTTFSVLGTGFEFACVAALSDDAGEGHSLAEVAAGLSALPTLRGADIAVKPFALSDGHTDEGRASHMVLVQGGDRPGLIAHLSEVFGVYGTNIVRMTSRRIEREDGEYDYRTRFSVHMPAEREKACCAAVSNTAGQLGLSYSCQKIS